MQIRQFEDKHLSHYSYAILSEFEKKIILIDPARNAQQYIEYANANDAHITGVIESHLHADFVSSHLELHQLNRARIYTSKLAKAHYSHETFDEGQSIHLGGITLSALNTPGHSPDGLCIVLEHGGSQKAVFTGDTLFIGDCGRPDLREGEDGTQSKREAFAKQMYHSLRSKLMKLPDEVVVYPAHGAGSLCGKNLSQESSSTIGEEKRTNWSLQEVSEDEFVKNLLADQPFIPQYFSFDVEVNRNGAAPLRQSIEGIKVIEHCDELPEPVLNNTSWVIDVREEMDFKKGHLPHSINLMENGNFETWLGSIMRPGEKFFLAGESKRQLQRMMERTASIGYESAIIKSLVITDGNVEERKIDEAEFKKHPNDYTIVDVRTPVEVAEKKFFARSVSIPLDELRSRVGEIPNSKPVVVHCSSGYRSAAASSLISSRLTAATVYDLGEAVQDFQGDSD